MRKRIIIIAAILFIICSYWNVNAKDIVPVEPYKINKCETIERVKRLACKCAKACNKYHGWECEIIGGPCMFFLPDSQRCAKEYGEGPDVEGEASERD